MIIWTGMKKLDLKIKDKTGASVLEGSILGIMTTRRKGYLEDGVFIKMKVVFGKHNTHNDTLTEFVGFWAVEMKENNTNLDGDINYYESAVSVDYVVNSNGSEVIGNVHD